MNRRLWMCRAARAVGGTSALALKGTSALALRGTTALALRGTTALALGGTTALAGCGFRLREAATVGIERLAFSGFAPRSPMAAELTRLLAPRTRIVETAAQSQAVLHAIADRRERSVVASTAAGQVRELQLRVRLEFRLLHPGGRELIAPTELRASRDMSTSESFALAKEQEEAQIFAAMQTDIALQVIRRLARADLV